MVDERIVEQQKEIYENAMRRHRGRQAIVALACVSTILAGLLGLLPEDGQRWIVYFVMSSAVVAEMMSPLSVDRDLSAHIKLVGACCLLGPIAFVVGLYFLSLYIEAGAETGRGMSFLPTMSAVAGLFGLVVFSVRAIYLHLLFSQYGQVE